VNNNSESTGVIASISEAQAVLASAWQKSRPGLVSIGIFSVFINLLKLALPLYILNILDRVISSGSLETLGMLTIITLIAVVCGILLEVIRKRLFYAWGSWLESLFGPYLFKAGMRAENDKVNSVGALRDLSTVSSFVSGAAILAWLDVIWAPVFIVMVFLVAPQLGYIVLVACLVAFMLGTANEFYTRDSRNATLKAGKANMAWLSITERDPEAVGSLNQLNGLTELWSKDAESRAREGSRTRISNLNFNASLQLVGRFVRIGVFGVGIWLVIQNTLTIGAVIAANILGRMAYSIGSNAMQKWRQLVLAKRAYSQIKKNLRKLTVEEVSFPEKIKSPALEVEDVSYRYPEQSASVFRRISVNLNPGELLCLLGPSASGKTTFCRLASGFLKARSGKILLGKVDIHHLQHNSDIREIGYFPQEFSLFQGTIRENIAGMPNNSMYKVFKAAELVGIHDTIIKLPKGYDTEIVDKEPMLSVGQRKAIAIARTFYGFPTLVVLDEPFAHLDSELQISLVLGLNKMRSKGGIVVMSTQDMPLAQIADKALILESGKHRLLSTPEELEELQDQILNSDLWKFEKNNRKRNYQGSNVKNLRPV
jgi:ATP-binding cassette, subfamily C, bacterial exporter for protease/lipase